MPARKTTPTLDEFIDRMKELCENEEVSLWEQGDLLLTMALSDEELGKVAQKLQRKVSTLRQRERVAREVPKARRNKGHAWTVYAVLIRIPDSEERWRLLDKRREWTVEDMETKVREWIKARTGRESSARLPQTKAGHRVGNVRVISQLSGNRLKVTIEAPTSDVKTVDGLDELIITCNVFE